MGKELFDLIDLPVCCTNCLHFRLCDEGLPYCYKEKACNIEEYEKFIPIKKRPCYTQIHDRAQVLTECLAARHDAINDITMAMYFGEFTFSEKNDISSILERLSDVEELWEDFNDYEY